MATLTRSEHMARVKGKDTEPEVVIRAALWRSGLRYRLNQRIGRVRPDVVFPKRKVAVFVDGCFWHGCPVHYTRPRSSSAFWADKLYTNVRRDRRQTLALEEAGWRVVRVWEHDAWLDPSGVVSKVAGAVGNKTWEPEAAPRVIRVTPLPDAGPDWEERELCLLRRPGPYLIEKGPRVTAGDKKRLPKQH